MARARLKVQVVDLSNRISSGATIAVFQFGTTTPLVDPLYKTASGSSVYTSPEMVTDSRGCFEAWMTKGQRVSVLATKSGATLTTSEEFGWDPSDFTGLYFDVRVRGGVADARYVSDATLVQGTSTLASSTAAFTAADVGKLVTVRPSEAFVTYTDGVIVSAGSTLTSATANWTAADVGKHVEIEYDNTIPNPDVLRAVYSGTITARNSATQVAISPALGVVTSLTGRSFVVSRPIIHTTIAEYLSATQVTLAATAAVSYTNAKVDIGTDNAVAIAAAQTDAAAAGGGTVTFQGGPNAVYACSGGLTMASNVHYASDGAIVRRVGSTAVMLASTVPVDNISFDRITLDQNHAIGAAGLLEFVNGSTTIGLDRSKFINLANTRVVNFSYAYDVDRVSNPNPTLQSSDITLDRCWFTRNLTEVPKQGVNGASENTQTLTIDDASYVRIERSKFIRCGSVQIHAHSSTACNTTTPMTSVVASDNDFIEVQDSNLWVVAQVNSSVMEQVHVEKNRFRDGGKWLEKGALIIQYSGTGTMTQVSVCGNTVKNMGYYGSSAGYSDANTASWIAVASNSNQIIDLKINDNIIDGANSAGTLPAGLCVGIHLYGGGRGTHIRGNTVRNMGAHGILLIGTSAGILDDRVIVAGNIVELCLQSVSTGSTAGGISVGDYCKNIIIADNLCRNNGKGGTLHSGIALGENVLSASPGTIDSIDLHGNTCYDDQTPQLQVYGIAIGVPNDATLADQPTNVRCINNTVLNNLTAGVYHVASGTLGHIVRGNVGHDDAGDVLLTTAAASGTFRIPSTSSDAPCAGIITIDSKLSNHYAVNTYLVIRGPGGHQAAGTLLTGLTVASGVLPTIADNSGTAEGQWTATNNDAGSTITVRWLALRQGVI